MQNDCKIKNKKNTEIQYLEKKSDHHKMPKLEPDRSVFIGNKPKSTTVSHMPVYHLSLTIKTTEKKVAVA